MEKGRSQDQPTLKSTNQIFLKLIGQKKLKRKRVDNIISYTIIYIMLVSFTGAQSTGKSTLVDKMLNSSEFQYWNYVEEVTRLVKRNHDVEINEGGDDDTQLLIMCQHIHNLIDHKNNTTSGRVGTVLDRCVVDGLIYSKYLHNNGRIDLQTLNICECIYQNTIDNIGLIFYTNPTDIQLVDDGERSTNIEFRNDIIDIYNEWLDTFSGNVVTLTGDVDNRFNQIINEIKKFNI